MPQETQRSGPCHISIPATYIKNHSPTKLHLPTTLSPKHSNTTSTVRRVGHQIASGLELSRNSQSTGIPILCERLSRSLAVSLMREELFASLR
ncbi:hypothetical protein BgiBS90_000087 [Biomphalaria glabrata]|nr:hypothetical protein BgiBS90_000087 [Biomphalaria glabrata]